MSKDTYTVTLFDEEDKLYNFTYIATDVTEAVTKAMDEAFRQMPNNKFALASIKGDEDKIDAYFDGR